MPKLKSRYKGFKFDNKFLKIRRELEKSLSYCGERYLDIKKKTGLKKYYSPEILKGFDKHYKQETADV
jgi:oligoribonuclease (3'-5' exoribonuclease)